MNESRTYGIEIELVSKVDKVALAAKIREAFQAANLGMDVRTGGYYHNTDSANRSTWDLKSDSSIRTEDSDFPYGIEVVSPVLRGTEGLKSLKVVCEAIKELTKVNKSTGLHVHHGVRAKELTNLSKTWVKVQDVLYMMVPPSRRLNRYCSKWSASDVPDVGIISWYQRNIATRYVGLNLESYWIRGTVEFRLAAGTTSYEKISNWVIFTQILIDKSISINQGSSSAISFSRLTEIMGSSTESGYSRPSEKKSRIVWDMARQGHSKEEIVRHLQTIFENKPYRVGEMMRRALTTVPVAEDERSAVEWAKQRFNQFSSVTGGC